MTPEMINELVQKLMETAETLSSRLFGLAMMQIYVSAVQLLIVTAVLIITGVLLLRYTRKEIRDEYRSNRSYYDNLKRMPSAFSADFDTPLAALAQIFGYILIVLSLIPISSIIGITMNPEWYAIKLIVETAIGYAQ